MKIILIQSKYISILEHFPLNINRVFTCSVDGEMMIPSEMPLLPRGDTNGHGGFPGHGAEHGGHGGFGGSVAGMFGQFGPDQMQMLQSLQQIAGQQKVKQEVRL